MERDERLLEFATPRQAEAIKAVWEHGSQRAAARATGMQQSYISASVHAVQRKAAIHGYAPDHDLTNPAPPGFKYKGYSTLRDKRSGEAILQWEKTQPDMEARERILREATAALSEEIPRLRPVGAPKKTQAHLLNNYVLTDAHIGMLSWHRETGADWDTEIAERTITGCMTQLFAMAPPAGTAVVAQLGDFMHSDGLDAVTPLSGHNLDRDTRYEKGVQIAIRTLRRVIDMALAKHDHVHVVMAEGNHDLASSVWLRQLFAALYEQEPRLSIDTSPLPYYAYRHGKVMLAYHHGHLKKFERLTGTFAAQFAEMWGATKYRYGHCGHLHSHRSSEEDGMVVTQYRTLAAKDAYAARSGYHAERNVKCVSYHRDFGYAGEVVMRPEMLEAAA